MPRDTQQTAAEGSNEQGNPRAVAGDGGVRDMYYWDRNHPVFSRQRGDRQDGLRLKDDILFSIML